MRGRRKESGFTIIELMIVIAIIAILASLAIPTYLKYQRKAKVSSYAMPVVRGCALDLATYCMENPGKTVPDIDNATIPNCKKSTSTPVGSVATKIDNKGTCSNEGALSGAIVTGDLGNNYEYIAKCEFDSNGNLKCTVVGR
ncbi:MAG: prepilin-type N-terminal cleavage/methylation domain-containing protein [Caldimicrobium sp.]